ncbi:unnamed protein product [Calypogeia fissa]
MDGWPRDGGQFLRRQNSNSSTQSLDQPLIGEEGEGMPDLERSKHVHWSGSTRSLYGLGRDYEAENDRPTEVGIGGSYVKSIIYGGLDAIVTSFALVASVSGGGIGSGAVLVLGLANLIADGISMGFGDYLSTTTEQNYAANEQKVADWEVERDLHAQAINMVEVYEMNGMEKSDAEEVVKIFAKYKDLLVEQKMTLQDGLLPPDEEEEAWKNGVVTFVSFLCFGCTPIFAYVILNPFTNNVHVKFASACLVTALALIVLGIAKARISGGKYLSSALTVLSNGGFAAAAAYAISWGLTNLLGIDEP